MTFGDVVIVIFLAIFGLVELLIRIAVLFILVISVIGINAIGDAADLLTPIMWQAMFTLLKGRGYQTPQIGSSRTEQIERE